MLVLIRVISIPDSVLPADGRGIGIWISLVAAVGVIAGGLLRAAEELLTTTTPISTPQARPQAHVQRVVDAGARAA